MNTFLYSFDFVSSCITHCSVLVASMFRKVRHQSLLNHANLNKKHKAFKWFEWNKQTLWSRCVGLFDFVCTGIVYCMCYLFLPRSAARPQEFRRHTKLNDFDISISVSWIAKGPQRCPPTPADQIHYPHLMGQVGTPPPNMGGGVRTWPVRYRSVPPIWRTIWLKS